MLLGKPEGKRAFGTLRSRRKDNIKNLTEIGCDRVDMIHLAQESNQWRSFVRTIINLWVP
jgi:hypothetical protein